MLARNYDVIIVGGRVAGSATALQLASRGLDVLVVERAARGSDTTSTHALLEPGIEVLDRLGVLDRVGAVGTPAINSTTFHYEGQQPFEVDLSSRPLYAPKRTVIDPLLVDAAEAAGADFIFEQRVRGLKRSISGVVKGVVIDGTDGHIVINAPLVIGADGVGSFVARSVAAAKTFVSQHSTAAILADFDGLDVDGYQWYFARHSAAGLIPTNNGRTCVFVGVSTERFKDSIRHDVEAGFYSILAEVAPDLPGRSGFGTQVTPFRSWPGIKGFTRSASGPGWALVGDAGAFTDQMSAHGMSAALRDSLLITDAVTEAFANPLSAASAWERYESTRDALTVPFIEAVDDVAAFQHGMGRIQAAHISMSKAAAAEMAEIDRRLTAPIAA